MFKLFKIRKHVIIMHIINILQSVLKYYLHEISFNDEKNFNILFISVFCMLKSFKMKKSTYNIVNYNYH